MTIAAAITMYILGKLATIRTGNTVAMLSGGIYPYKTDAGQLVDVNLEYTEHPDDLPQLVLYPGDNSSYIDESCELGTENHSQEYIIEGFIADDKGGDQGRALANDIAAAIKSDPWMGERISMLQNFKSSTSTHVGETVFSIAQISFSAVYVAPYGSE